MTDKTQAAAAELFRSQRAVPVGSRWKHKKGGLYQVLGHALDTDNGEARVRYQRVGGPDFDPRAERHIEFVRPISEWTADRFTPLTEPNPDDQYWICKICGYRKVDGCGFPERRVRIGDRVHPLPCPLEYRPPLTSFFERIIQALRREPG